METRVYYQPGEPPLGSVSWPKTESAPSLGTCAPTQMPFLHHRPPGTSALSLDSAPGTATKHKLSLMIPTRSHFISKLSDSWNLHIMIGFNFRYCNKNISWYLNSRCTNSNAFSTLTDSWNLHMKIGFSSGYCNKNIPWDCVGAPEVYVSGYVLFAETEAELNLHVEVPTTFLHRLAPGTSIWWLGLDKGTATRIIS